MFSLEICQDYVNFQSFTNKSNRLTNPIRRVVCCGGIDSLQRNAFLERCLPLCKYVFWILVFLVCTRPTCHGGEPLTNYMERFKYERNNSFWEIYLDDIESSIVSLEKAARSKYYQEGLALLELACFNQSKGNEYTSVKNQLQAISLFNKLQVTQLASQAIINLAAQVLALQDYWLVDELVMIGLRICDDRYASTRAELIRLLVETCSIRGDYEQQLVFSQLSLEKAKQAENPILIAQCLLDVAKAFDNLDLLDSAIVYCDLSTSISAQFGVCSTLVRARLTRAKVSEEKGELALAIELAENTEEYAIGLNMLEERIMIADFLSRIYTQSGAWDLAYFNQRLLGVLSFNNSFSTLNSKQIVYWNQVANKANHRSPLGQASEVIHHRSSFDTKQIRFILLVFCAVLLAALIIYSILNNRRRSKLRRARMILDRHSYQLQREINQEQIIYRYAEEIQKGIMPTDQEIDSILNDNFVLFKPKDKLSGDFYWVENQGGLTYVAAADCTGHNVSGALMSLVCASALNRAVISEKIRMPNEILDRIREIVSNCLDKGSTAHRDSMDISLCALKKESNELFWSGAVNPVWVARKGELIELKGDAQSIIEVNCYKPFSQHRVGLIPGDNIYLLTDGYKDQFGGGSATQKKFSTTKLKELVLSIESERMDIQGNVLAEAFDDWKQDNNQIDDVCMLGIKYYELN